jgi:hypothetical protein
MNKVSQDTFLTLAGQINVFIRISTFFRLLSDIGQLATNLMLRLLDREPTLDHERPAI